MIRSGERKSAPGGANHDEICPAKDEPGTIPQPSKMIKDHDFSPSHLNGFFLLPEFRVAAINRAFISYPEA